MGGAQPLAVTLNGGACLVVDVDGDRLHRRVRERYLDEVADDLDDAVALVASAKRANAAAVGRRRRQLRGGAARAAAPRRRGRRRHRPDLRARPAVLPAASASTWRTGTTYAAAKPEEFTDRARESMARHVEAMVGFLDAGAEVFDYGNSIRDEARQGGYERAFDFPGFVPAYIRPLFARGQGAVPVGGAVRRPGATSRSTDQRRARPVPGRRPPAPLDPRGAGAGRVPGAAGADLLARARRAGPARACGSTSWSPRARWRRRSSSGATTSTPARSPRRTGRPRRWPTAPTRSPTGRCSTRWSPRRPGRPGCRSTTAAASGSAARSTPGRCPWPTAPTLAARKLARVLTNDPGMGVLRHVDAGYARGRRGRRRRTGVPGPDAGGGRARDRSRGTVVATSRDVGRGRADGGYRRFAWTREDHDAARVVRRARPPPAGSTLTTDRAGNQWAWWGDPDATARASSPAATSTRCPAAARSTGRSAWSAAFAAARRAAGARVRARPGRSASRASSTRRAPGSASPAPGSRLLTGALDAGPGARRCATPTGSTHGRRPARGRPRPGAARPRRRDAAPGRGRSSSCTSSRAAPWCTPGDPVGVGRMIWPHGRWRVELRGEANHAGTTPLADRRDPMLALAALIAQVRAGRRATPARWPPSARCASTRTASTRSRRRSRAWLDVRAPTTSPRSARSSPTLRGVRARPRSRGRRSPCSTPTWRTPCVALAPLGRRRRVLATGAGHDAGILAAAGIPTAMLFVRNPTGVSHAPAEHADEADCLAGVDALRRALLGRLLGVTDASGPRHALAAGRPGRTTCRIAVADGRITAVTDRGRRRAGRPPAARRRAARLRQHALARVPPGAARPHARRRRHVLDLAGPDVRARRHARPRTRTWTWPAPPTPRWCSPASPRSASSTTCTTARTAPRTPTRTPWPRPCAGRRATPGCGSPCSTPRYLTRRHRRARSRAPSDGSATATPTPGPPASRALRPDDTLTVGAAIHSVRAVPLDALPVIAAHATGRPAARAPVRAARWRTTQSLATFGVTPTRRARGRGRARPGHHRGPRRPPHRRGRRDPRLARGTGVCLCPTTEQDLGDGIAPGAPAARGGCPPERRQRPARPHRPARARPGASSCTSGWPSEAARRLHPRRAASTLLTTGGHASLGDPTGGRIAVGAPADLVAVRTDTPRTAGADPAQLVLVAGSADVDTVVVGGVVRVEGGRHVLGDVGAHAGRGDPRRVGGGPMTSHLVTGIGELITHDDRVRRPAARRRTASREDGLVAWVGPAARRPRRRPPDRPRRRRGGPGLRRLPHAPRLRRRPVRRVRGPDGRHALHGRRHRDDGRRHPRGDRRRAPRAPRGPRRRGPRPGHDDDRDQERLRPRRRRRGTPAPPGRARSRRRRRSSARTSSRPASTAPTTSPWSPARCSPPARRTPAGPTCSASPASPLAFDGDEARAVLVAAPAAGLGLRVHGNQLGARAGRRGSPSSSAPRASTTART